VRLPWDWLKVTEAALLAILLLLIIILSRGRVPTGEPVPGGVPVLADAKEPENAAKLPESEMA
jgi:hypothetical protein